jgi:hypothetical protein
MGFIEELLTTDLYGMGAAGVASAQALFLLHDRALDVPHSWRVFD